MISLLHIKLHRINHIMVYVYLHNGTIHSFWPLFIEEDLSQTWMCQAIAFDILQTYDILMTYKIAPFCYHSLIFLVLFFVGGGKGPWVKYNNKVCYSIRVCWGVDEKWRNNVLRTYINEVFNIMSLLISIRISREL